MKGATSEFFHWTTAILGRKNSTAAEADQTYMKPISKLLYLSVWIHLSIHHIHNMEF